MPTGTPRGGVTTNRTLKLAHTAAVVKGEIIISNGLVLVAQAAYAQDVEGIYVFAGPVELPKKASLAVAVGDAVYFDASPGEIAKTAADGTLCGVCTEAALAAGTVVQVELIPLMLPTHTHA